MDGKKKKISKCNSQGFEIGEKTSLYNLVWLDVAVVEVYATCGGTKEIRAARVVLRGLNPAGWLAWYGHSWWKCEVATRFSVSIGL